MPTNKHLSPDEILDGLEARSDMPAAARLERHLESRCLKCATEFRNWERTVRALEAGRSPEVPRAFGARLFSLADRLTPRDGDWARVVATLRFDSRLQPGFSLVGQFAGAREADGEAESFSLVLDADGTEVYLLCERENGNWGITGQAVSPDSPVDGWRVAVVSSEASADVQVDSLGLFRIQDLPPGNYELLARSGEGAIDLGRVELPARPG